jgi:2-polyprenyl-3-methyl-5-hydroxy-6-metoxy-1,4-benzoquinol methylase
MEYLKNCPLCNNASFKNFISCIDHTVSRETFNIVECASCRFRFTNPRPDENEIGKYYQSDDYISHSGRSKGIIGFLYKIVRKVTMRNKLKLIQSISPSSDLPAPNLLDIGCGTGEFLGICKKAGYHVLGIEPSERARGWAKANFSIEVMGEEYIQVIDNQSIDIVTMWHVLEHVHQLNKRVGELYKLLKTDGVLVVAVPNCTSYDAGLYKKYWAAYDVPRHLYHFTPSDINRLFQKHQFTVSKILPMKFDAYYVSMLSEKYKHGSLIRGIWNGLRSNFRASGQTWSGQVYIIRK